MGILLKKTKDISGKAEKLNFRGTGKMNVRSDFKIQILSEEDLKRRRNSAYTYIIP